MYWWVNLSQARRHELEAGYLWSAVPAMRRARAGDIVFVHAGGQVAQLGLVTGAPFAARRSATAGRTGVRRSSEGLRLPAHFEDLLQPLQPTKHLAALKKVLPPRLSPLRSTGDANPAVYFALVSEALATVLCELLGGQVEELQRAAPALENSERADEVAEQSLAARADLDAGTRKRLLSARRGLGVSNATNSPAGSPACSIAGTCGPGTSSHGATAMTGKSSTAPMACCSRRMSTSCSSAAWSRSAIPVICWWRGS